tara:strand:+ start:18597 stop:19022 length:426 start_codon:yes stop_codon:yes gene_type:complete
MKNQKELIDKILDESKNIAVVGISKNTEKDSYKVAWYLENAGYNVIPVNPAVSEVLDKKCYPSLTDIPDDIQIDLVDIFRRPEFVAPIVDDAIKIGTKTIWMQDTIEDHESAKKAADKGIQIIMNNCTMREHKKRHHLTNS